MLEIILANSDTSERDAFAYRFDLTASDPSIKADIKRAINMAFAEIYGGIALLETPQGAYIYGANEQTILFEINYYPIPKNHAIQVAVTVATGFVGLGVFLGALEHGLSTESMIDIPAHIDYWHKQVSETEGPLIDALKQKIEDITRNPVSVHYETSTQENGNVLK